MESLELQISLVLFFALGGYLLSSRFNQSTGVGVILIGAVMGPSVLNLIRYIDAIDMALAGYFSSESVAIGVGMSPRGEVAMIVALIGLTSKAITQDLYVGVVLMSLITTVMTPAIIQKLNWTQGTSHG